MLLIHDDRERYNGFVGYAGARTEDRGKLGRERENGFVGHAGGRTKDDSGKLRREREIPTTGPV